MKLRTAKLQIIVPTITIMTSTKSLLDLAETPNIKANLRRLIEI